MTMSLDPTAAFMQEAALTAVVADRIAGLRKATGLSFDALAQRAGVAKGTLVQIEQGRANPSISVLCRLAGALQVSVADLVAPPETGPHAITVIQPQATRKLWSGPLGGSALLLAGTPGPDMLEIWHWLLMPGERFEASNHGPGTREVLHVTQGTLSLQVGGQISLVAAGSSAIARTDSPHAYANQGGQPVRFTMVVHEPAANPGGSHAPAL